MGGTRVEEDANVCLYVIGKILQEKEHWENLGVDENIILKWI